jgi:hypothetical protein
VNNPKIIVAASALTIIDEIKGGYQDFSQSCIEVQCKIITEIKSHKNYLFLLPPNSALAFASLAKLSKLVDIYSYQSIA